MGRGEGMHGLKAMARLAGGALVALLWLAALALLLEFGAVAYTLLGGWNARAYMSRVPPPPMMRQASPEEAERVRAQGLLPLADTGSSAAAATSTQTPPASDDPQAAFAALLQLEDPDERTAVAAFNGDYWVLRKPDGSVATAFGDPDPERLGIISQPLRDLPVGQTQRLERPDNPLWTYDVRHLAYTEPGSDARLSLFRFHDVHLREALTRLEELCAPVSSHHLLLPGFLMKPNLSGWVTSDQFGFANPPVASPKPADTIRIVGFGGSTIHDNEVGQPRTTEMLQQLLQAEAPGWRVEVINCGIPGSTSFEMRRHALHYLQYEPDLLIYYEGINDIIGWPMAHASGLRGWKRLLLKSHFASAFWNAELLVDDGDFRQDWGHRTRVNLLTIQHAAREAGVPMAAASFAWAQKNELGLRERNFIEYNARTTWGSGIATYATLDRLLRLHNDCLKSFCLERGLGYIPIAENFHHGLSHFHDLCHFTPQGMQERAELMAEWLRPWLRQRIADLEYRL